MRPRLTNPIPAIGHLLRRSPLSGKPIPPPPPAHSGPSDRQSTLDGGGVPLPPRRLTSLRRGHPRHRAAVPERHGAAAPADADLAAVDVVYEPCIDGDPDPGEVVWAWVSYEEDPHEGKDRPVVIIGRVGVNLAAVALTTKGHDHPDNVFVGSGSWDPGHRDSWAKLDRIVTIDPASMRREGAALDKSRFDALISALRQRGA